jgi:hypothetical protein
VAAEILEALRSNVVIDGDDKRVGLVVLVVDSFVLTLLDATVGLAKVIDSGFLRECLVRVAVSRQLLASTLRAACRCGRADLPSVLSTPVALCDQSSRRSRRRTKSVRASAAERTPTSTSCTFSARIPRFWTSSVATLR